MALLCWAIVAVGMFILAVQLHPVPANDSAETDGYLLAARKLLHGELPADRFRPLLYPGLVAALAPVVGDVFTAARLVSAMAFASVLLGVHRLGVVLHSRWVGAAAVCCLMANARFVISGFFALTDLLFLALVLWSAVLLAPRLGVRSASERRVDGRRLGGAGLLAGLAWSTRYQGMLWIVWVLVVAAVGGLGRSGRREPYRIRGRSILCFVLGCVVAAAPQMVVNVVTFGSPTFNENWRNVAMKLSGHKDWSMLYRDLPAEGWWPTISGNFGPLLSGFYSEVSGALPRALAGFFGGVMPLAAVLLCAVVGVASVAVSRQRDRRGYLLLGGFAVVYLVAVCALFFALPRLCLPLVPIILLFGLDGAVRAAGALFSRVQAAPVWGLCLLALGLALATARVSPRHFDALARAHSVPEHALAAMLPRPPKGAKKLIVAGALSGMAAFYDFRYHVVQLGDHAQAGSTEKRDALRRVLQKHAVDYLIVGTEPLPGWPPSLWDRAGDGCAFLKAVESSGSAVLYECRP